MSADVPNYGNRTGHTEILRSMQPGDTLLVLEAKRANISALCSMIEKGGFRCRTQGPNVRVWRVKREG